MNQNPELQYWLDVTSLHEAKQKIIAGDNFDKNTENNIKIILEMLQPTKQEMIIDFGCGIGRLMKPLSSYCKTIMGLDISDAIIQYGMDYCKGYDNVIFHPMQSESVIDLPTGVVSKIYSLMVLQHIEKPKILMLLYEFSRILKNNGRILIQLPSMERGMQNYIGYLAIKAQLNTISPRIEYFTKEEIKAFLDFVGLQIVNIKEQDTDYYILAEKIKNPPVMQTVIGKPLEK